MRIKSSLAAAGAAAVLVFCAAGAQAADLITNGGFETGDFSGWTVNSGFTQVYSTGYAGISSHGGQYLAWLGDTSASYPYGTLSQTVSDTAGDDLVLSYFLKSDGGTPNFFSADWNGSQLAGSVVSNAPSSGYVQYSFHVTATGSDTLTFHDQNQPGYLYLDDVSLVSGGGVGGVPEPATWAMMLLGFFGAGATLRSRRNRGAGAIA